eukprot:1037890-Alexandrium_andersonii.AAC.1
MTQRKSHCLVATNKHYTLPPTNGRQQSTDSHMQQTARQLGMATPPPHRKLRQTARQLGMATPPPHSEVRQPGVATPPPLREPSRHPRLPR